MTHHLIYIGLKINQLKLIDYNHVWLGPNLCKFTLQLKLVSLIYFNPMVQSMLMNYFLIVMTSRLISCNVFRGQTTEIIVLP